MVIYAKGFVRKKNTSIDQFIKSIRETPTVETLWRSLSLGSQLFLMDFCRISDRARAQKIDNSQAMNETKSRSCKKQLPGHAPHTHTLWHKAMQ